MEQVQSETSGRFLPQARVIISERTPYSETIRSKPVADVKPGNLIFTAKGKFRRIIEFNIGPYDSKVLRISPTYKPDILVIPECQILTMTWRLDATGYPRYIEEWKVARDLRKGDMICVPRPARSDRSSYQWNHRQLKIGMSEHYKLAHRSMYHAHNRAKSKVLHVTPELMRLVGYYLSEGFAYHPHKEEGRVQFSFNKEGEERYVEDCSRLLREHFRVKPRVGFHEATTVVQISSVHAYTFFSRYFGRVGPEKHLPRWVIRLPPRFLKELVKGRWRGDGTSSPKGFSGNSSYIDLASGLALIFERLGFLPSFLSYEVQESKIGDRIITSGTTYLLSVSGKQRFRFSKVVDEPATESRTGRTAQLYTKRYGKSWVPTKGVQEEDYEGPIYSLDVEKDHTFTLSGIAVHCGYPI